MSSTSSKNSWVVKNVWWLKTLMRVIFGLTWLVDGALKFAPGLADSFPDMVRSASDGQPGWLKPWFDFWYNTVVQNPAPFVYLTGVLEVALGLALTFGLLRKIAYLGSMALGLLIWSVPEGFGGPYGPGSTDIGAGVMYAFISLSLIIISAAFGPSKLSLDRLIERRFPSWAKLADFKIPTLTIATPIGHS